MHIDLGSGELCLRHGEPVRLTRAAGLHIGCLAGTIWITVAGEPADVFLMPGHSYRIRGQGLALIESIGEGRVRLENVRQAGDTAGWFKWLVQRTATPGGSAPFSRTGPAPSAPGFPA